MAEQRLIDANALCDELKNKLKQLNSGDLSSQVLPFFIEAISDWPTIDPETLPLVQELREELKPVKKKQEGCIVATQYTKEQRDAAFRIVVKYGFCGDCRWKFESKNCVKYDCYQNAVKVIKDVMFEEVQTDDRP